MAICLEFDEDNVPYLQLGSYTLRLTLEELDEYHKEMATRELNETPENVKAGLEKFKQLIRNEPNLTVPFDDDNFYIKFLRPCKFKPDVALKVLRRFYKFKIKYPKFGYNITPANVRKVYDSNIFSILPTRCAGARIMIINIGPKWNPKEVSLEELFKAVMVVTEISMMEPLTQLCGVHVIIDLDCLQLVHICQFSPLLAKLVITWIQDCVPVRLKGIHIVNQPYLFGMLFAIFKPFLGERLRKCLFVHGSDRESLIEKMSADSLPEYLGGDADIPEYPGTLFSEMLFHYEEDFKELSKYGYNMDKIKQKPVDVTNLSNNITA